MNVIVLTSVSITLFRRGRHWCTCLLLVCCVVLEVHNSG